jgi:uncharacterized protein with PIN domain
MLGKLSRWLRMLGHDVNYFRSAEDKKLVELAKKEKRILLTRDRELVQRATGLGVESILNEATEEADKLAFLAERFGFKLEIDLRSSRCPMCNADLKVVTKEEVADEIPETTSRYYSEFWKCMGCNKVYWQGAHWKKIEKTLENARSRLRQL